jgi:hypothetical protein
MLAIIDQHYCVSGCCNSCWQIEPCCPMISCPNEASQQMFHIGQPLTQKMLFRFSFLAKTTKFVVLLIIAL